jgi:ribA/ribD-fused uncharacterized protein
MDIIFNAHNKNLKIASHILYIFFVYNSNNQKQMQKVTKSTHVSKKKIKHERADIIDIVDDEIHIDDLYLPNYEDNKKDIKEDKKQPAQSIIAFWRPSDPYGYLGQWYKSDFEVTLEIYNDLPVKIKKLPLYKEKPHVLEKMYMNQAHFNTAEKFMMISKAVLFRDNKMFDRMFLCDSPMVQKKLGRQVKNFDQNMWEKYCQDIVIIGNYLKFSQNDGLRQSLKSTGNALLVEGSPLDKIWGVGMRFDDPNIYNITEWKGTNYLGNCLMIVRDML